MPFGSRRSRSFTMLMSAATRRWCSSTAGMSCASRARWTECWVGSYREGQGARCGALLCRSVGPRDLVLVECVCGHTERLTATMLTTAGVEPDHKVQDLTNRMRCPGATIRAEL